MSSKLLGVALLVTLVAFPAVAQEGEKGKRKGKAGAQRNAATQLIKVLEPVGLTAEQTEKIQTLGKAADASMKSIREETGLTPAIMKKRMEAMKSLKDSGKKGKELATAVAEASGLSEANLAAIAKMNEARNKFQKSAIALLTDEQKEKLPKNLVRLTKEGNQQGKGKGKGKGKRNKDAA
ncbi:hypothetical protein K227x_23050 [Rubripirellula lacrimiformis]|uniref:LTXXQ motif protein n=1 Tax=Rubripirellula lacrimiformis TaxID=1930273 RepID=A0A517N9W8_9BACT|nr:Spy/CpxP family protein refolding chaperone [Rubripirellula lacrimiformis]QDT03920.1 hypothetical protein K227x_23050 [Rubripirellula lacrimiformis]